MEFTQGLKYLVGIAGRLLMKYKEQIHGADEELASLQRKLVLLHAELSGSTNIRGVNEILEVAGRQIISLLYKMEDEIEYSIVDSRSSLQLIKVSKYTEEINETVDNLIVELTQYAAWEHRTPDMAHMIKTCPIMRSHTLVRGFDEEMERIIERLEKETEVLDIIPIVGMPGLGKTTLAYKIFNHPNIRSKFDQARIWVNVSTKYRKKDLLFSILSGWIDVTEDTRQHRTDQELSDMVYDTLEAKDNFLILLDDVPGVEAWKDLKEAFPRFHKAGKILITTQHDEVASGSDRMGDPHKLRLLTPDESWDLLRSEAFEGGKCPEEVESDGKAIAKNCGGLPYLLVKIARALKSECKHASTQEQRKTWEGAHSNLSSCLKPEDFQNYRSFYDTLPYHLRPCFLYVGMFPEGYEIPARRLTRLWIAEGFVHTRPGIPLEETAYQYLRELIDRNLIMIAKRGHDDHIKTCRVHRMLQEFCRMEAEKENFFQVMKYSAEENVFVPSSSDLAPSPRLSLGSNVNDFFKSRPSCSLVRSFMCFSEEDLQPANISSIPDVLKSLRVWETKSITFKEFPNDWNKMVLLRYIVLSTDSKVIPEVISKLRNMQTLIIYTTSPALEIKTNIWRMSQLTHVETNVPTKLPIPKKGTKGNELQTLGMISPESCTNKVFGQLGSLRRLGICGQLDTLVKAKGLNKLHSLEKLKLVNDLSSSSPMTSKGKLLRLQSSSKFPPHLRSLTLCATNLEWKQMSTLGALYELEVLKLKDNAFKGDSWGASEGGFPQLQVLHIDNNDLVVWKASANPFPKLRCLMLRDCRNLVDIPPSLGESLQKLELKGGVTESVVASARRIAQEKEGSGFKLCIVSGDK